MPLRITTSRKTRVLVAFVAIGSLALSANVAVAATEGDITGTGSGPGIEEGGSINQVCPVPLIGEINRSKFTFDHYGTYDGVTATGTGSASYVGPTVMVIDIGPHLISPEGTYVNCDTPGAVAVKQWDVTGSFLGGSVSCHGVEGSYIRRAFEIIEFDLKGRCTVNGNVVPGSVVGNNRHVVAGTITPCFVPIPGTDETIPPSDQNTPCPLDHREPDRPADSVTETSYVVTPEPLL